MEASQAARVDRQDRWVPAPSQLELELRCCLGIMEIDRRVELQRSEEYRRMMLAMVGAGGRYPGQLLSAPRPVPEREGVMMPVPMPVGGSSSSPPSPSVVRGHPAALPVPHGAIAQAVPVTWERDLALPSSSVPSSSSSQLSDGSSRRRPRGRGRGRGGRGRAPGRADVVASSTRFHEVCRYSFLWFPY